MATPAPSKYAQDYLDAADLFDQDYDRCQQACKHNLTDPTLPPYWKLKNYLLYTSASGDWYDSEKWYLAAERIYAGFQGQCSTAGELEAMAEIRESLDQIKGWQEEDRPVKGKNMADEGGTNEAVPAVTGGLPEKAMRTQYGELISDPFLFVRKSETAQVLSSEGAHLRKGEEEDTESGDLKKPLFAGLLQRAVEWEEDVDYFFLLANDIDIAFARMQSNKEKDQVRAACDELLSLEKLPTLSRVKFLAYMAGTEQNGDYAAMRARLEDARYWLSDLLYRIEQESGDDGDAQFVQRGVLDMVGTLDKLDPPLPIEPRLPPSRPPGSKIGLSGNAILEEERRLGKQPQRTFEEKMADLEAARRFNDEVGKMRKHEEAQLQAQMGQIEADRQHNDQVARMQREEAARLQARSDEIEATRRHNDDVARAKMDLLAQTGADKEGPEAAARFQARAEAQKKEKEAARVQAWLSEARKKDAAEKAIIRAQKEAEKSSKPTGTMRRFTKFLKANKEGEDREEGQDTTPKFEENKKDGEETAPPWADPVADDIAQAVRKERDDEPEINLFGSRDEKVDDMSENMLEGRDATGFGPTPLTMPVRGKPEPKTKREPAFAPPHFRP